MLPFMRGKLLVGIVAIIIVLGAVFVWMRSRQPHSTATPTASSGNATSSRPGDFERQLYLDIAKEGLTPERAKQLFSLVVAPLPDVTVPADGADPDEFCATSAFNAIFAVWPSLTDAQRAVVSKYTAPAQRRIGRNDTPLPLPASFGQPRVLLASLVQKPVDNPKFNYKKFASDASGVIAGHLNQPPMRFGLDVYDYYYDEKVGINKLTKAATYTWDGNDQPQPDGCHIRVFDSVFVDNKYDETDAQSIMTHEMFHCYQQRAIGNQPDLKKVKRWILEGEADWVMATIVHEAKVYIKDSNEYAMTPTRQFVERGQDGLGVFGHLADVSGSDSLVWTRMLPMIATALASGDLDAFQYLIGGQVFDYYTTWGPSYFLEGAKPNWGMTSPGQPPMQKHAPLEITVNAGDEKIFPDVGYYEAGTVKLSSDAYILAVGVFTGYGRLHDEKFGLDTVLTADTTVPMCLKSGGCTCPDGSAGASLITKPAKAPIYLGLAGADGIALSGAVAEKLDEFCKKPKDPPLKAVNPPRERGRRWRWR